MKPLASQELEMNVSVSNRSNIVFISGNMESHRLLPSNNIKQEPACEADNAQSSAGEIISELQVFDKLYSKIPASVKNEQPEVYIDYPCEDTKVHPCLQEQLQMEKKMVSGNTNWKLVKDELSDILCEDKSKRLCKMVDMTSCCGIQKLAGHSKTETRISEDTTTLLHYSQVSLIGTENTASKHDEHCSSMSESKSSVIEINTKICLKNENGQIHNTAAPVKSTQISTASLDYTVDYANCSPQRIQGRDTQDISDVTINVVTFLGSRKTTHIGEKLYKCGVCDASFSKAGSLKCHMRTHTDEKPFKCDNCGASFPKGCSLQYHMRMHTGEKPYKCGICTVSFTGASTLKYHMTTHTGKVEEKPHKCDICAISFTYPSHLKYHKRIHTGVKPYKCNICTASFTQSNRLMHHMRTHTGERPYKCDSCAVSFTQAVCLKRHIRTHTGEKPYMCDVCAASFTTAGNLKCHMRSHTGEKPFKCHMCATTFTRASYLKSHMRTHTGEKPYTCVFCGVSFAEACNLRCHMRTHTGEKPYKCDVCAASFITSGNLKCHMKTHTREKPYN